MFIRLASPYKPSSSFLKKNFQRKRNYWNNFFSFVFPPIANVRHTRKKIPCIARHALSQRLHREKMPETCKKLQWRSARRERESANGVDKTEIPIQRATTKLTTQCTKFGVSTLFSIYFELPFAIYFNQVSKFLSKLLQQKYLSMLEFWYRYGVNWIAL